MIGLRPKTSDLYVERARLLRRLPEGGGHVVWLEAPYGYGKSVLTAQWAAALEADGWRVVWLALMGEDARGALARVLELPATVPWSVLLEALWQEPTLLILEDLEGTEHLAPILKHAAGLVLISSRKRLPEPELPRLRAEGRLLHLTAGDLAFTVDEARALLPGDPERAERAWAQSQGWSLPLHLAALTGATADGAERAALLQGIRESLEPAVWDEALLLAALSHLPLEHATDATRRLAEAGFAQALEAGYRLHPLAAETALEQHLDAARAVLAREGARLPPPLRGLALERLALWGDLGALLEAGHDLARHDPAGVVRWDEAVGGASGPQRSLQTGEALCLLGRKPEGVARLLEAAAHPAATPAQRLAAYREALWHTADVDLPRARAYAEAGEALLEDVPDDDAVKFMHYATRLDYIANDFERAEAGIERALERIPKDAPKLRRLGLLTNLAVMRWYRLGDLDGQQRLLEDILTWPDVPALQAGVMHWNLGMNYHLLHQNTQALEQFRHTQRYAAVRPLQALQARAMELILTRRYEDLSAVMARLALWEQPGAEDRLRAAWALALLEDGQADAAVERADLDAPYCRIARAQVLHALGRGKAAMAALEAAANALEERDTELHWTAAQYRLTRDPASLERLLALTTSGARVLPHFVPLPDLPRDRPELSDPYLLPAVLRSGWKEAVRRRHAEIPDLELRLLGVLDVRVLGEAVSLTQRPREIVLLSALGQSREQIAEALWPDLEPEKMRNNLHFNLNALRKTLEPWGVPTYLFEHGLERVHTDVQDLERALLTGDAEAVARLYGGDLAPGVDYAAVNDERERLRERTVACLCAAAERADPERAAGYLERALEIDPLHEDALRTLLRALVAQGRRSSAQRRYDRFARRLRDELGLEPAPETQRALA
jgi:DNA-binding SARP family transcriptional activator